MCKVSYVGNILRAWDPRFQQSIKNNPFYFNTSITKENTPDAKKVWVSANQFSPRVRTTSMLVNDEYNNDSNTGVVGTQLAFLITHEHIEATQMGAKFVIFELM